LGRRGCGGSCRSGGCRSGGLGAPLPLVALSPWSTANGDTQGRGRRAAVVAATFRGEGRRREQVARDGPAQVVELHQQLVLVELDDLGRPVVELHEDELLMVVESGGGKGGERGKEGRE